MTRRAVQRICWWLLVVGVVVGLSLTLALERQYDSEDVLVVPFVGYALIGAVVAYRRPGNPIGWIFLAVGFLTSLGGLAGVGVNKTLAAGEPVAWWGVLSTWYDHVFWFPTFMLATGFTFLLYPEGLLSRRWRPVLWLAVAGAAIVTVLLAVAPVLDVDQQGVRGGALMVDNPLSPTFVSESLDVRSQWWYFLPLAVCLASVLVAIVSAVVRFHRSAGVERQQMRLFAIAIVLLPFAMWITVTFAIALTIIPVACGLAILRYHLYDIDRIIGRTTAYALVTGILLLVYVAVVTTITQFVPESNSLAVAAATLSAAAAFRPVLGWAQRLVNRRFNREQYDAERAVEEFAAQLRNQVDIEEVGHELLATLSRTVQPSATGLWIREQPSDE